MLAPLVFPQLLVTLVVLILGGHIEVSLELLARFFLWRREKLGTQFSYKAETKLSNLVGTYLIFLVASKLSYQVDSKLSY